MEGEWKKYRRKGFTEARPYVPGEDLNKISVSLVDKGNIERGHPGMICRNPEDHEDQWFVYAGYFNAHMEEIKE